MVWPLFCSAPPCTIFWSELGHRPVTVWFLDHVLKQTCLLIPMYHLAGNCDDAGEIPSTGSYEATLKVWSSIDSGSFFGPNVRISGTGFAKLSTNIYLRYFFRRVYLRASWIQFESLHSFIHTHTPCAVNPKQRWLTVIVVCITITFCGRSYLTRRSLLRFLWLSFNLVILPRPHSYPSESLLTGPDLHRFRILYAWPPSVWPYPSDWRF